MIIDNYHNKLTNDSDVDITDNDASSLVKQNIAFQMGKADKVEFNLDFQYPFSIFQAFGLGVAIHDTN